MSDPIFPDKPIPQAEGHAVHDHAPAEHDWVVVHRGGEGSKAHVEALERKLIKARITARVEHDDQHRVVLEVHRDQEEAAAGVLGPDNVSGRGAKPHQTREERIQAEERAELAGPFRAATWKWLLGLVALAVLVYLVYWFGIPR
jgi:hypothetical protein